MRHEKEKTKENWSDFIFFAIHICHNAFNNLKSANSAFSAISV